MRKRSFGLLAGILLCGAAAPQAAPDPKPAPPGTLPRKVSLKAGERVTYTLVDGGTREVTLKGTRLVFAHEGVTVWATATVDVSGRSAEIPAAFLQAPVVLNGVRVFVDVTREFSDGHLRDGGGVKEGARLLLSDARYTMTDVSRYRWPFPNLIWGEGGNVVYWQGLGGMEGNRPKNLWHHGGFDQGLPFNTPFHMWHGGVFDPGDRGFDRTISLKPADDGRPYWEQNVLHLERVDFDRKGKRVKPGERVGLTGQMNWPHLHWSNRYEWAILLGEWYVAHATPVQRSYLKDWLVIGPFPDGDPDRDFLGGEASAHPEAGASVGGDAWKLYDGVIPGVVDVGEAVSDYPHSGWGQVHGYWPGHAAYLATYLHTTEPKRVTLQVGGSDPVSVWVGGEKVLQNNEVVPVSGGARGTDLPVKVDRDRVPVRLKAGWNRVLIKTVQKGPKAWKLSFRVSDEKGRPVPDVTASPAGRKP